MISKKETKELAWRIQMVQQQLHSLQKNLTALNSHMQDFQEKLRGANDGQD